MKDESPPELSVNIWTGRVSAKGRDAIRATRGVLLALVWSRIFALFGGVASSIYFAWWRWPF
jgi:hypothetical protein